jgi:hypothetical protein
MRIPNGHGFSIRTLALGLALLSSCAPAPDDAPPPEEVAAAPDTDTAPSRLAVLWTSGDREVALKVAFMYTEAAGSGGWFDEVELIVWGPSSKLLSEDAELQASVARMQAAGIEVVACRACADSYGVTSALEGLGIEVKYMGQPLTEMLKGDWTVLTF